MSSHTFIFIKAMEKEEKSDPVTYLLSHHFPRSLSRCAVVLYHQVAPLLAGSASSKVMAWACFIHAMKLRNKTIFFNSKSKELLRKSFGEHKLVAVELCIAQLVRTKVILIESCLRRNLKLLVDNNPHLVDGRESIIRVALRLCDTIYQTRYCLYPSSAAAAALLHACHLIGFPVVKVPWEDEKVQRIYSCVFRSEGFG